MRKIFIIIAAALILTQCGKRDLPLPTHDTSIPDMKIHMLTQVMNPAREYRVEISVSGGKDAVDYIQLDAIRLGESTPEAVYYLNDDGDALHPDNGDLVALDGVFTKKLLWRPKDLSQQLFLFRFTAIGAQVENIPALLDTILSLNNKAPRITQVEAPELLPSGFQDEKYLFAAAEDSNGLDDIAAVTFKGIRHDTTFFTGQLFDDGTHGDAIAMDGRFSLKLDSTFAASKKGNYQLEFLAVDRSDVESNTLTRTIIIENEPPRIFHLVASTEAIIPASGTNSFLVTIDVRDPQGASDIRFVGYKALRPDSVYANQGLPVPMVDNGLQFDENKWSQGYFGDLIANDGTFSITAIIKPTDSYGNPTLKGNYIWTFYATDFTGQTSEQLVHVITLK